MSSLKKKFKPDEQVLCKVRSWTIGKSKEKGTKYIRVSFSQGITWTGWLTDKTTEKTMKTLEDLGFKGRNLAMLTEENALDMENEFLVTIESSREYEGNTYYDARWVNKAWEGGFKRSKVDDDLLKEFESVDTRPYIEGATDITKPAATDDVYSPEFASDMIPF
jgi:hypothetical protein